MSLKVCYDCSMSIKIVRFNLSVFVLLIMATVSCTHDRYQMQADRIKDHTNAFYRHLSAGRVTDAVYENERLESFTKSTEKKILYDANQFDQGEQARQWLSVKTGHETAAENWLALAHYFVKKKKYEQARGTYQRVIDSYSGNPFESYAERAKTGLRDLDLILRPIPPS